MKAPPPYTIHSIVVRCPNWIGDAVMATPVFSDLRMLFPKAHIVALAPEHICELLQNLPIDEFISFSREPKKKRAESKRIILELRKRRFDLGILLTRSFSSAWMFWKGNVTWRLGFKDHLRSLLLNIAVSLPKKEQHDVLTYRAILNPFGALQNERKPHLVVRNEEKARMQETLASLLGDRECITLNIGAAYGPAKCWPKERFKEVAKALLAAGKAVIFIGDEKSKELVEKIMQDLSGPVFNFAGKTTIRELMALLSLSRCVVSNDSGPMHMAAALGTPLVAIFGSTSPQRTGPFGLGLVIKKDISCSPCYKRTCPRNAECMTLITVEDVLAAIEEVYGTA